ncbi:hypothetical protein BROUX41_006508 [Berkeleyomyces rouxiae]|uniref:uncharacterized protein n=1 Tax=Berkeleyomyces rouxiae TaxID=2035830 RepID=UPI003B8250F2
MSSTRPPTAPSTAGIVSDDSGNRVIPESTRADGSTRKAIRIRPGFRPAEDIERFRPRAAQGRAQHHARGPPPGAEYAERQAPGRTASSSPATPTAGYAAPARTPLSLGGSAAADTLPAAARTPLARTPTSSTPSTPGRSYNGSSSTAKSPAYLKMSWRRDDFAASAAGPSQSPRNSGPPTPIKREPEVAKSATPPPSDPVAAQAEAEAEAETEVDREKRARGLKKKLKQARELQDKEANGKPLLPEQLAKVEKIDQLVLELEALGLGGDDSKEDAVAQDGDSHV